MASTCRGRLIQLVAPQVRRLTASVMWQSSFMGASVSFFPEGKSLLQSGAHTCPTLDLAAMTRALRSSLKESGCKHLQFSVPPLSAPLCNNVDAPSISQVAELNLTFKKAKDWTGCSCGPALWLRATCQQIGTSRQPAKQNVSRASSRLREGCCNLACCESSWETVTIVCVT